MPRSNGAPTRARMGASGETRAALLMVTWVTTLDFIRVVAMVATLTAAPFPAPPWAAFLLVSLLYPPLLTPRSGHFRTGRDARARTNAWKEMGREELPRNASRKSLREASISLPPRTGCVAQQGWELPTRG